MTRPFSIVGALCFSVLYASIGLLPESARPLPPIGILLLAVIPLTLVGIPFAAWLPHARAGFIGDVYRVPSHTLLIPRWLVCLMGTTMIGVAVGTLGLAVTIDARYGLLLGLHFFGTIAFVASAQRRFNHHPSSEFVMQSPFPYPLRKRM